MNKNGSGKINKRRLSSTKDWRPFFNDWDLQSGARLFDLGRVSAFAAGETSAKAQVVGDGGAYLVTINNAPSSFSAEWDPSDFKCSCKKKRKTRLFRNGRFEYVNTCEHEAAALFYWEHKRGLWTFSETDSERDERVRRMELEQKRAELFERKQAAVKADVPVRDLFKDEKSGGFFDVVLAVYKLNTTQFAVERAAELQSHGSVTITGKEVGFGRNGEQQIRIRAKIGDELETGDASLTLGFGGFTRIDCSCANHYRNGGVCEHELVLMRKLLEITGDPNLGDATDMTALNFFSVMGDPEARGNEETRGKAEKEKTLVLSPRLVISRGEVAVNFKMGRKVPETVTAASGKKRSSGAAAKTYVLRNLKTLVQAASEESEFHLSSTQSVDLSKEDFTDESLPWLTFIQRRVSESLEVNSRLQARSYYGYNQSLRMQDSLSGALLDQFYEAAEGGTYEAVFREGDVTGEIFVGHADLKIHLKADRVADSQGKFYGILVTGHMPVILAGSADKYILGDGSLSRITKEEERFLAPYQEIAGNDGSLRFRVGLSSLAEFYYRVVPVFIQSRYIDFEDNCAAEAEQVLPPEPEFLFRFDLDDRLCYCEALVSYGGESHNLLFADEKGGVYRDEIQENRIRALLEKIFPGTKSGRGAFSHKLSDDFLYHVMTEVVPELSRYGEVQGSEKFSRYKVRSVPQIRVGVSIESGLMDISIISKDVPPEELLAILGSYRAKKRYHRLKSGDYVPLTKDQQLQSIETMLEEVNLRPEDVIGKDAHLPLFRALYLDAMLKKHEDLAADRDRTYRALVKNFATIRDADYEAPAAQAEILRPYQLYGFKWLRTLTAAGFGGILADEMGLGKTLQAITLLQSLKDEGIGGVSLIVCPASLVYNWQEEIKRFAPELKVSIIAGTVPQRKALLADAEEADVLVTGYDLFKKDIALYEKISFTVMFLDEAQYIKNQKVAVTKAVKAASARYRFALTGTPVENRLAELWSIFDFLMPGFLYSYQEFSERFETPIVKNKDEEAADRLRRMTAPFILRRLKSDVLKDLPEKLEEVRYTRFEEDQRKVYDGQVVHMKEMLAGIGTSGSDKLKVLTELMRIRQICCDPSLLFEDYHGGSAKREACLELVQSAIGGGHRMLIFSQFTSMLALLEKDLKAENIPYMLLTGATSKEQRIRMVREFNEGDVPVFLISLKAGGTGLNLTGADVVIHYDPWWNVAAQNQATDRAHRIGQTNTVTVYRLIVKDSIEEKILALQDAKHDLAESILSGEGGSITALSTEELLELLS